MTLLAIVAVNSIVFLLKASACYFGWWLASHQHEHRRACETAELQRLLFENGFDPEDAEGTYFSFLRAQRVLLHTVCKT